MKGLIESGGGVWFARKLQDSWIFQEGPPSTFKLFALLLWKAQWSPRRVKIKQGFVELQPGQVITGANELARKVKADRMWVERRLKWLENEHHIEQQTSNHGRVITIINWRLYQDPEFGRALRQASKRAANEQQASNTRAYKNHKEPKEPNNQEKEGADSDPRDLSLGRVWFEWAKSKSANPHPSWSAESFANEIRINRSKSSVSPERMFDYIRETPFWAKNAVSPANLRKRNASGVMKLDTIAAQMEESPESLHPKYGSEEWKRQVFGADYDPR